MNTNNKYRRYTTASARALVALALVLPVVASAAIPTTSSATKKAPSTPHRLQCERTHVAPVSVPVGKSSRLRSEIPITQVVLGNSNSSAGIPGGGVPPTGGASTNQSGEVGRNTPADRKVAKGSHLTQQPSSSNDDGASGVADVQVLLLSPTEIYVLGKTVGATNALLVGDDGGCTLLEITVGLDVMSVQSVLATLLPEEQNNIKVVSAQDSLVLTGTVQDATAVDRAVEIASAYVGGAGENGRNVRVLNMLNVGAPQQVMLEVKVAEISKTLMEKLGMRVVARDVTGGGVAYTLLSDFLSGGAGVVDLFKASSGDSITLDAQKDDGLIKVLAEPNVMAISGQEGSFLSGGKIFIPVAQTNENGFAKITLEEKEFGIALKFTPTVLAGGRINLKVAPEVSELNRDGIGISAPGINGAAILPSFTTRRAATTVQLHDGQSFAIGGLIKNNTTTNIHAFPFLGEIPVLGALFRSTDFQTDRSELVFVITPRLVKPLPENYALPTDHYVEPTRADVMWRGKVEGSGLPAADRPELLPGADAQDRGGFEPK